MKVIYPRGSIDLITPRNQEQISIMEDELVSAFDIGSLIPHVGGSFSNKGFYLSNLYDWIIVQDEGGSLVLVPLKKRKRT